MVKRMDWKKTVVLAVLACVVAAIGAPAAFAAEAAEAGVAGATSIGEGIKVAGIAIGAALALVGGALGCGRAQASIGAGGTGALAEKPELFTSVLILVALPETLVVLGFVIGFLIVGLA